MIVKFNLMRGLEEKIMFAHQKMALGVGEKECEFIKNRCAKMAVTQMAEYLENGNIKNSVNFPNCEMGVCATESRIAVVHF